MKTRNLKTGYLQRWMRMAPALFVILSQLTALPAVADGTTHIWSSVPDDAAWEAVQNGDTIELAADFTGEIKIPEAITELTIRGKDAGTAYADTNIAAERDTDAIQLTIENLNITAPDTSTGLTLGGGRSVLNVKGTCSINGGKDDGHGIYVTKNGGYLNIEPDAVLNVSAVNNSRQMGAIRAIYPLHLQNDGVLNV